MLPPECLLFTGIYGILCFLQMIAPHKQANYNTIYGGHFICKISINDENVFIKVQDLFLS